MPNPKLFLHDPTKAIPLSALDWDRFYEQADASDLDELKAYEQVAWVRRCVDLRANALSSIPVQFTRGEDEVTHWEFEYELPSLLWRTSAALQIYGKAYWIRDRNLVKDKGYRWVLPTLLTPKFDRVKGLTHFERKLPGQDQPEKLQLTDVIYFWMPATGQELGPGKGWVTTALAPAGIAKSADDLVKAVFDNGAFPSGVFGVSGSPSRNALDSLQEWFTKNFGRGVKNAGKVAAVNADITFSRISMGLDELALEPVIATARQQIATAAGVPQTMLEDAANFATASEHHQAFYEETVVPESVLIETALNKQLFDAQGLTINLDWQSLDIFQVDEAQRSESLARLTQAGLPVEFAMEILGFDLPNQMTYDQLAAMLEKRKAENTPPQLQPGGTTLPATAPNQPATVPPIEQQPTRAVADDLDRWRRKSLSSLKANGIADVPFVSDVIPDVIARVIHIGLEMAGSAEEVRAIFADPLEVKMDRVEPSGDALPPMSAVSVSAQDIDAAIARWNRVMPSEFADMLEAEVEE
jgi:HK97 family phage portal protein